MRASPTQSPIRCDESAAAASANEPKGFADLLRERTRALHICAERSGVIGDLLHGRATRSGYVLLLRNLLPAYIAMEKGLARHHSAPILAPFARPEVYRAAAIKSDLEALCGERWSASIPILPQGRQYEMAVVAAAKDDGALLVAHVYVRYLGDLNGGRILRPLLARVLKLRPRDLGFYDFPGIADIEGFKRSFRQALNLVDAAHSNVGTLVKEAMSAFEMNIALSLAVQSEAQARAYELVPPRADS